MPSINSLLFSLKGKLIVSCQAEGGSPFNRPEMIAAFARAAEMGGAAGLRIRDRENLEAVRRVSALPMIGLTKGAYADGSVLITPTVEEAVVLWEAGAKMVAVDATSRPRGDFRDGAEMVAALKAAGIGGIMADVSTVEEGVAAEGAGADVIGTTLAGYTPETRGRAPGLRLELVRELVARVTVPVFAEGGIWTPDEARAAREAGAYAVVVGTAITRPVDIVRRFAGCLEEE